MKKEKPKINVVEIDLGIDVSKKIEESAKDVSKEVRAKISKMVEEKKSKPSKKQLKKKEQERMEACVQKLFTSTETGDSVTGEELLETYEVQMSLSPFVLKLKHYLKKTHPEWSLEKVTKKGKSAYRVIKD